MHCLLPRGKGFAVLPLALAVFALVRFSVVLQHQTASRYQYDRIVPHSSSSSLLSSRETTTGSSNNNNKEWELTNRGSEPTSNDDDDNNKNSGAANSNGLNYDRKKDENETIESNDDEEEKEVLWEETLSPQVVWLASYPNSGTSYTMTLVERASDLSTASNYGSEVTYKREDSLPIYPHHPEGPFWDGMSGKLGSPRPLPTKFVLTKTHCGGRCIKCAAEEYVIPPNAIRRNFVDACERTTHRRNGESLESRIPATIVAGMVHLIRNPYHNTVARFHLERRNMVNKRAKLADQYPLDAIGFHNWCHFLDESYSSHDSVVFDEPTRAWMEHVPCYGEFYKWTQWHNLAIETATHHLGRSQAFRPVPTLTIYYEDYDNPLQFNQTFVKLMEFLQLPIAADKPLQQFRHLPTYEDHFTKAQRLAIQSLIRHVASPPLWNLIQHYFDTPETPEDSTSATSTTTTAADMTVRT